MGDYANNWYSIMPVDSKSVEIRYEITNTIKRYKVVSVDEIKEKVLNGEEICLDNCYIKDFSYQYVSDEKNIPLTNFQAKDAFFDGIIDFEFARFTGEMACFEASRFANSEVDFRFSSFKTTKVSFVGTIFGTGTVDFEMAFFHCKKVDFLFSTFQSRRVSFEKTTFDDVAVDFIKTDFGDADLIFKEMEFQNGIIRFFHTIIGKGSFELSSKSIIDGEISFVGVIFEGNSKEFKLKNAAGVRIHFIDCIFNANIKFMNNRVDSISFYNCTNRDVIFFSPLSTTDSYIDKMGLFKLNNIGTISIDWENYSLPILNFDYEDYQALLGADRLNAPEEVFDIRNTESKRTDILRKEKIDELIMLKENYHNRGQYDYEDATYVVYKNIETSRMDSLDPKRWILSVLYFIGKYGTDPFRVFATMVITVGIFGILYSTGFASIYPETVAHNKWSPMYYSVITFFTIGYGDLSAQNLFTAIVCGIEGFLGVFLMSYFSVALVRKILR